jgi:ElaB/YqjD/DUF883 family membrane-anchored ribosome-binding protein
MIAARNSTFPEKKDLHFGGLGATAQPRLVTMADTKRDAVEASQPLLKKAREAVEYANSALHGHPWAAVGLVAALGLTVGYLLSRRS